MLLYYEFRNPDDSLFLAAKRIAEIAAVGKRDNMPSVMLMTAYGIPERIAVPYRKSVPVNKHFPSE